MKILQVLPYFVPAWDYGGPVSVAYSLSKELVKRGHSVTVYTTDTLNSRERINEKEETIDKIKVRRFGNWSNRIASKHKIFLSTSMISGIRNSLREFDIVHVHEYRTIQNVIVHHYAKKYGIPYVLQSHGSIPRIASKRRLKQIYDTLWGHELLKGASRVIALTETEAEQYKTMGIGEDKIEIVPNGVDLSEFDNRPQRGEFRSKYGLNNSDKIILYLGRIHKIKGIDLLVRAFAALPREPDKAKLVIAGPDDGYLLSLKKLITQLEIEEKVLFTGPLYGREKLRAYVDADVYVLPSVYETFPVGILEAYACGTPVITTEAGDQLNLLHSQAGLVVHRDKKEMVSAIFRILNDGELRRRFGRKGRLLVQKRFDFRQITDRIEKIYTGCLTSVER